jgi:NAD(P)H-hydrate epimerase
MVARVASATETVEWERATIESGTSSSQLMRRAGEIAARLITSEFADALARGVLIHAGPGNNGGDGWVVAGCLAREGFRVEVLETGEPKSDEACSARADALAVSGVNLVRSAAEPGIVVDALLGTGSSGAPRGEIARRVQAVNESRSSGARVAALDLPTGLDATSGEHDGSVVADLTVSFGAIKRGHLLSRDVCGAIAVADIGLVEGPAMDSLPMLVDSAWVSERVPPIPGDAHKGTRKRLAIVGGGKGMAGAAILAGEGALRSGIGLLRIVCAPGNEVSVHAGIPAAIVHEWPRAAGDLADIVANVDAIAIGPGLGKSSETRDLVERVLLAWSGPVVLDADALNIFAGDTLSLAQLLAGRPAAITPHPAEMARLLGVATRDVLRDRFEIGIDLATQVGAAVLLKGSPTVVFAPSGERYVSAAGTAALATGGSGDVLTGMTTTLMAQMGDASGGHAAADAAACAAYVHGRAAELCGSVRGVTLDDVLRAMPEAWKLEPVDLPRDVIARLERLP